MSVQPSYSLKKQLIIYSSFFSVLLGCALMYASYRIALEEITEILDKQMQNLAMHVAQQAPDNLQSTFDPHHRYHEEDLFIDVWQYSTATATTQPDFSQQASPRQDSSQQSFLLPLQQHAGFYTHHNNHGEWQAYVLPLADKQIQISQQQSVRQHLAFELAGNMLIPYLFFIPLALFGFNLIIRKGLAPLDDFKTALATRSSNDLQPIQSAHYPLEIIPTIDEMNHLFQRIHYAQEQQRQFIADAAHELRTPLTALNLQTQILLKELPPHAALDKLHQGLNRIQHLVAQLLNLAKQESSLGHLELKEPINLTDSCILCVEQLIDLALQKNIDLGIEQQEHVILTLYPSALSSIIYNLIDNAIKYTPNNGVINVSIFTADQYAYIQIEDSGLGISEQEQQHISKRFYRVHQQQHGSGLGLAIVEQASRRLEGKITFSRSETLGGLKVTLQLALD